MILILIRIGANIPVIMMGETGCGKTSLIRKLSELMNNGEDKMKILNIHAGITDKEIVDFLYEKKKDEDLSIIEEAKILQQNEEIKKKIMEEKKLIYTEKKLWVFLDEINTCNCMGLICEIMTKHSCQGEKLPKSLVFIGACNPYRMANSTKEQNGLKIKDAKEKKLVYTVNPLPHALLNFVFNFGSLTNEDEKKYINNMVIKPIENLFLKEIKQLNHNIINNKGNIANKNELEDKKISEQYHYLINLSIKAISDAQKYVRDNNDVSAVSLREIRRFSIFYSFFVNHLKKRKTLSNSKEAFNTDKLYRDMDIFSINKYAINLSIYICYYLRLTKKIYREELSKKLSKHFGFNFEEIPKKEQMFIANNIKMRKGIAKNKALLENLFTLFSCVNAKVPLFIVGKPGCSKSLSVQLLFKSMNGENSNNELFKTLPKLISYSYQGSKSSTSEGVLKAFERARKLLQEKDKDIDLSKIISMIFFDEMGLAENSENNPLKVIHSQLEYDLNEGSKKIAFVGISNWRLDASKMNRGIYLSIPDSDLEDLQLTAITIAESYGEKLKGFDIDETITYHSLYDVLSSDQNHTYVINYENRDEGEIWVKFDTFLMGEGPQITLDGNEIKKCEEISYPDEEDEGEYIKCTVTKTQFPVEKYASYNVIGHVSTHLSALTQLEELYLEENRLRVTDWVAPLLNLRILELGANKITLRVVEKVNDIKISFTSSCQRQPWS